MATKIENILGIEIGGTKIQLLLENTAGEIISKERFAVDAKAGAKGILNRVEQVIHTILVKNRIDAIGIGFGGPIDYDSGVISHSSHITGWQDFPLTSWIRGVAKCPVFADNDANVAALGEAKRGAGTGLESIVYVTIGSGVGGGGVRNGFIVHGRKPGESEIGHISMDFNGTKLQDIASGWGIDERIRKNMKNHPHSPLTQLCLKHPGNEAQHLGPALLMKDPFAQNIFEDTVKYLALAFSHVVHLIHPDALVLGGGVSKLGEPFRKAIEDYLFKFVSEIFQPCTLLLSDLGEDVVPLGAIEMVRQKMS